MPKNFNYAKQTEIIRFATARHLHKRIVVRDLLAERRHILAKVMLRRASGARESHRRLPKMSTPVDLIEWRAMRRRGRVSMFDEQRNRHFA
jgi:hypothetical protein